MAKRPGAALLLLALLAGCLAAAQAVRSPGFGASSCTEACMFTARMVDDVLGDPEVVQSIVSFAEAACPEIGGGDKCKHLAEGLLPVLLQWLSSPQTAQQFCTSTCPAATPVEARKQQLAEVVEDGASCAMCNLVVRQVQEIFNSSLVFDKINTTAQEACAQLPADMASSCSAFVNKYEPLLEALIAKASPEELCELLGVCAKKLVARLGAVQLPALDAAQRRKMPCTLKLVRSVQMARLSVAPGVPQGALGDSCDMCKMAVIEAHSLVTNPTVQQSIVNYTASLCGQFQSFNDTCVLYVEMYAPLVFSLLEQYLVPDSLCATIGICPSKPPAASQLVEAEGNSSGYALVSTLVSWVQQVRDALGVRVAADALVSREVANVAAKSWTTTTGSAAAKKQ